ncbi:hypothetical protein Hbl1158_16955 (plasmid) [Halobaculum sp. CBA1158]|uniref:hypothetical protein n=1 Tax=Halobaculum sp. CBA1158 TaxID=2904243 RepID=UPI001F1DEFFD|nr:hypothetical protein [Halobaculum sp. CBA1158]UIP01744.1 hypothetical protein Hbl1158_16955 [Halobaculum sp. CBA1158]
MSTAAATQTDAPTPTTESPSGIAEHLGVTAKEVSAYREALSEKRAEVAEAREIATEMSEAGCSQETIEMHLNQRLNLQNAVITVVVAGATAYAGINVMSSIGSTMQLSEGDMFYNSSQALEEGVNSFFTNMPTVFVVIALVLIIGYLTLLR